jgi:putative nucleotidyltransferase with HDIG domain
MKKKGIITPSNYTEWVDSLGLDRTRFGKTLADLEYRFQMKRLALVFVFSLALSYMLLSNWHFAYRLSVGDIVRNSIVSPTTFDFIDESVTEDRRKAAEIEVPAVFDVDFDVYEKKTDRLVRAFRMLRGQVQGLKVNAENLAGALEQLDPWRTRFETELGVQVPERIWEWLVLNRFSVRLENMFVHVLDQWSQMRVADQVPVTEDKENPQVAVRSLETGKSNSAQEFLLDRDEARDIGHRSEFEAEALKALASLDRADQRLALRFVSPFLTANLKYNSLETDARKKTARERVNPVRIYVRKNQVVVKEGTTLTAPQKAILEELERRHYDRRNLGLALACALMLMTVILVFFSYVRRFTLNRVKVEGKDIFCMGVVTLVVVGLCKLTLAISEIALASRLGPWLPESNLVYLMPIATGPMLVGLLLASGEILWLFTIFLASALGVMVDMNFSFILVAIVGGISAARGVYNCKSRNDIYWAGLRAGLVSAFVIVLVSALNTPSYDEFVHHAVSGAGIGLLSGVLSAFFAMMLIPLIENVFNYTTDVKLLELSNLNHPLLKDLIVKAPGTYHHSLVVGSMVEAAAEEIGANPLLAKVMAYYHDIGKMEHAQYFIENQRPGHNPHDNISPHMSKHILVAHVKDGAEMARKHKLGQPIIDGILQHHGTTLISFFFNKAQEQQDESLHEVHEEDFRYPGPKPQFREAALCMLADSIEAAARSLDEPTPARLQNIVKNIIQRKFLDGQLDECNLTLRDLSILDESFSRTILGVYHARIDYPQGAGGGASGPASSLRAVTRS